MIFERSSIDGAIVLVCNSRDLVRSERVRDSVATETPQGKPTQGWFDCCEPTLRQAWSREYPRPQCAFEMSMFNVSCNSH